MSGTPSLLQANEDEALFGPLAGGLQRLTSRLSRNVALEMIATSESVDPWRAFQLGLADRLVNSEALLKRTMARVFLGKRAPSWP